MSEAPRSIYTGTITAASIVFGLLFLPAGLRADLDPGLETPYQLHVIAHFDRQSLFTPIFKKQLKTHLHELLQQTYGKLAEVKILDRHPLLEKVQNNGLREALDGWNKVSDVKTCFVLIDFADGGYRIQTRQHDGPTGMSSPAVRTASTPDRRRLAHLIARLVDRDFGLTGTVVNVQDDIVEVAIRGGKLGVSLERWIKPGDVFAVCRIAQIGRRQKSECLHWGLLRVQSAPVNGICRCTYFCRFHSEKLAPCPGCLGHRCLKLPTTRAPLTLQLVDDRTNRPLENVQVHLGCKCFAEADKQFATNRQGMIRTTEPLENIVFVRVVSGTTDIARFPVALVGDKTVTCRVTLDPEKESLAHLQLRCRRWVQQVYEDLYIAGDRVSLLNARLSDSPDVALKYARRGLQVLNSELHRLHRERVALKDAAREADVTLNLDEGVKRLNELAEREKELTRFIDQLDKSLKEARSEKTKKLRTMLAQAALLEKQAKYDEALALYGKVLDQSKNEPEVKQRLEKLKQAWKLHGKEHEKARKFIYEVWTKAMTTAQLKENLGKAKENFAICRRHKDYLTPRKMLQADLAHAIYFKKRLEELRQQEVTEDAQAERKLIIQLAAQLQQLHGEVTAWVESRKQKRDKAKAK